ncbi:MAG: hypothetical protein IKZ02_04970 [Alphaproteobacteria bacterium]|nr:hypothetical protein [Alphaproteobacteria bacterium]
MIENVIKEGLEELGLICSEKDIIYFESSRYILMNGNNRELLNVFLIHVPNEQVFTFYDG